MKNFVSFSQDTIYPGVYVPLIKGKEVLDELKHLKKEDMLVNYYWNKTAWMTSGIWNLFLLDLNEQMIQQN